MIILSPQQKRLLIASSVIWGLAFLVALIKSTFKAPTGMTAAIVTQPKIVKVMVNGRLIQNGRYLTTPQNITLKPGKSEIKIVRDGYRSHVVTVDKIQDEKMSLGEIILVKKPQFETIALEVVGDRISKPYYIEVNKGFFYGETPLVGSDLPLRGHHILEIYPEGTPEGVKYRCTFSLAEQGSKTPVSIDKVRIKIARKSDGSLQATGCKMESEEP